MKALSILFALICISVPAAAGDAQALLVRLLGDWQAQGEAFGRPAHSFMTWTSHLDGRFMRLDYRIEMARDTDTRSEFQGVAYYDTDSTGPFDAFWADSSGDLHPIAATRDGDALVAHWGLDGHKQGRTRYELLDADRIEVTDWIKTPEGWRQFNQAVFARVGGGP